MDIDVLARVARERVEELFHRHFVHDHAVGLRLDRRLRRRHEAAIRAGGGMTGSAAGALAPGRSTMWPSDGGTYGRTCSHPLMPSARATVTRARNRWGRKAKSRGSGTTCMRGRPADVSGIVVLSSCTARSYLSASLACAHRLDRPGEQGRRDGTALGTYGSFGSRNAAVLESLLRRLWVFTRPT